MLDAVGGHQLLGEIDEQRRLVRVGDIEGVDVVRGDESGVGVDRFGGELDAVGVDRRRYLRDRYSLLCQPDGLGCGEDDAGREAPGALVHHADGEAEVLPVGEGLGSGVAQADRLGADPLDPEIGVLAAQVDRPGQRGVGQGGQRQGEERVVDAAGHGAVSTSRLLGRPSRLFARLPIRGYAVGRIADLLRRRGWPAGAPGYRARHG